LLLCFLLLFSTLLSLLSLSLEVHQLMGSKNKD